MAPWPTPTAPTPTASSAATPPSARDWAVNSTNGADGAITALSTYDTWTNSGGSATANYLLNGSSTLTGALAANSLKIANTDVNQTLNLGSNNLTVTSTSATALGGVLYAGGGNNKYTINGTGGLLASTTTGELIIHTHAGTLDGQCARRHHRCHRRSSHQERQWQPGSRRHQRLYRHHPGRERQAVRQRQPLQCQRQL